MRFDAFRFPVPSDRVHIVGAMRSAALMHEAAAALDAGEWEAARGRFEAVLEGDPTPEALLGLGTALSWLGETGAAVAALEQAYAAFRRRPEAAAAAATAFSVILLYGGSLGNVTAERGWIGRLARLIDEHDLAPMRGWLSLCRAASANQAGEHQAAFTYAGDAVDAARGSGGSREMRAINRATKDRQQQPLVVVLACRSRST
jgi:tetratricopeptide (TPR) repeat protein